MNGVGYFERFLLKSPTDHSYDAKAYTPNFGPTFFANSFVALIRNHTLNVENNEIYLENYIIVDISNVQDKTICQSIVKIKFDSI